MKYVSELYVSSMANKVRMAGKQTLRNRESQDQPQGPLRREDLFRKQREMQGQFREKLRGQRERERMVRQTQRNKEQLDRIKQREAERRSK